MSDLDRGRRKLLGAGAATTAGLWVAPSVLTFDQVAAAVGSCGTKPRQIDMSAWSGSQVPSSFTTSDGTAVTMSQADPFGVQQTWTMGVYTGTLNGLDNPAITAMENATNGAGVTVTFTFSPPRALSFSLVDVDYSNGNWRDTVEVIGYSGGSAINPSSMTTGAHATQISPTTVQGTTWSNTSASNVEVDFQTPIDTLTIRHYDTTTWTRFQWIGIHDFHWC